MEENHLKVGSISFIFVFDVWVAIEPLGDLDRFGDRWALQLSVKKEEWFIQDDIVKAVWSVELDNR